MAYYKKRQPVFGLNRLYTAIIQCFKTFIESNIWMCYYKFSNNSIIVLSANAIFKYSSSFYLIAKFLVIKWSDYYHLKLIISIGGVVELLETFAVSCFLGYSQRRLWNFRNTSNFTSFLTKKSCKNLLMSGRENTMDIQER